MTEKIKRIYISAPITGMEDTADQRFNAAAKLAKEEGYIPINPFQENRSFCQWGDAIVAGLRLLIIRLYHREDEAIAEKIARRLKQPKKDLPNPCIQSLVLLMRMYLENITPDYSRHEENALGILRNDLQYINYNI